MRVYRDYQCSICGTRRDNSGTMIAHISVVHRPNVKSLQVLYPNYGDFYIYQVRTAGILQ